MQTKTIEPRRLRRLALAIAAAPACEFDDLVTFFVDIELYGDAKRARALYPVTWKHFQSCKRCSQSYCLLKSAFAEETNVNVSR